MLVESRCGAVALGGTYLLPPLSFGGASMVPPWLRFHIHRVAGGGRPPPAPTERGVRISRNTLFGSWFTAFTAICSSFVSMVLGVLSVSMASTRWCRPECGWNSVWRILREHESIVSGNKVNRQIDWFCGDGLPTIDLAHVDLS